MISEQSQQYLNQIRWRCHRGMLELDLLLLPFFDKYFKQLSLEQQQQFERLLTYPDPVILAWLTQTEIVNNPDLVGIINLIRSSHASKC